MKLRNYQKECIEKKKKINNCLIKMWCGTGKTRIFTSTIFNNEFSLNVIVFPSLGLINQYNIDYVNNPDFLSKWNDFEILSFCSEDDGKFKKLSKKIKSTTNDTTLRRFLKKKSNKLISVTYQSFEKFVQIIKDTQNKINYLVYDEAHHTVGSKIQDVIYNDIEFKNLVDKTEYYTATPINRNGIIMYDKENPENSLCGPITFEYNKYHAESDGYSRKYDVILDLSVKKMDCKNKYHYIFESIIRNCLSGEYNYWNVLTFHSGVNISDNQQNSVVKEFASSKNKNYVKRLFKQIQNKDFPETKDKFKEISLIGIYAKTQKKDELLRNFDRKVPGRIMILSSCRTIGEGIDTKWANMEVPVDPTKSLVYETQKIGRITRKPEENMPNSILLLPVCIDPEKYKQADTPEKKDELIRRELDDCGDFSIFLNVISAFKYQMDPELYELCLKYPNMYSPEEVKNNLKKQGFSTEENQGTIVDNINYLLDESQDLDECLSDNDKDSLENIALKINKPIQVHTQNYDVPIEIYNEQSEETPIHLFRDENNDYFPLKSTDKIDRKKSVNPPKKREKLFTIKTNPEFQILWKLTNESFQNALETGIGRGILDCEISFDEKRIERWKKNLDKLKKFIDDNKKTPSQGSKNKDNKILASWLNNQKINYKKKRNIMKDEIIYKQWTDFITDKKYSKYFRTKQEIWDYSFTIMKKFIDENKRLPKWESSNKDEKYIAGWLFHQKKITKEKSIV